MADDYYNILGVSKNASDDDIKKAYRKLVHKHHPDKGGDEAEFKKVNEAYQVLSNSQKRKQYDMFGSAGAGSGFGGAGFNPNDFNFSGSSFNIDLEDIFQGSGFEGVFESFFGGSTRTRVRRRVETLNITLEEAFTGLEREVDFGNGKRVRIEIPRGIETGNSIKVDSSNEEEFYVKINVLNHPRIKRHGRDIVVDCNLSFTEALLGCKKNIELIKEELSVKIPSGVSSGEIIRIGGKGMHTISRGRGDAYLKISINTPKRLSRKAKKLLEELQDEGL